MGVYHHLFIALGRNKVGSVTPTSVSSTFFSEVEMTAFLTGIVLNV